MRQILLAAFAIACMGGVSSKAQTENGLNTRESAHDAAATIEKLETAIKSRGMKVFTRIDHADAAAEAGLKMPPATVLVFGNPKAGTPNFLKSPTLAIDLPLKMLVWQDAGGKTFVSWNSGKYIIETLFPRHGLKPPQQASAEQENLLFGIVGEAVK